MNKTLLTGGTLVAESGLTKSDVLIGVTGEVEQIAPKMSLGHQVEHIDATGLLLFPLLIDCHVHFREPGMEQKATMESEAAAALAGGIGMVCDMPNTIPPTVTVAALADKVRRASHVQGVAIKFFFGCTEVLHLAALRDLWTGSALELRRLKHHCAGVKLYLDHSTGNQKIDGSIVEDVFRTCAKLHIPIVAHCEDPAMNAAAKAANTRTDIAAHSMNRPPESEVESIRSAIVLAKKFSAALHIAHLSTAGGLERVRQAKKEKIPVTCEVAPHHLFLTTDDYKTLGTLCKMNPPLRSAEDRDALWQGIADGTVDCIATDHAPHTREEKESGAPLEAPSGVPGVETMLPLLLSVAAGYFPHPSSKLKAQSSKLSYSDILRLCFTRPNQIFNVGQHAIEVKKPARIALIDPKAEWTLTRPMLKTKCGWSPFEGWKMRGRVQRVIA